MKKKPLFAEIDLPFQVDVEGFDIRLVMRETINVPFVI